jgi:hypothetical protein
MNVEIPYRMMVESMNEGDGDVDPGWDHFYRNGRFGEMIQADCETLVGTSFHALIVSEEQSLFETTFRMRHCMAYARDHPANCQRGIECPSSFRFICLGMTG